MHRAGCRLSSSPWPPELLRLYVLYVTMDWCPEFGAGQWRINVKRTRTRDVWAKDGLLKNLAILMIQLSNHWILLLVSAHTWVEDVARVWRWSNGQMWSFPRNGDRLHVLKRTRRPLVKTLRFLRPGWWMSGSHQLEIRSWEYFAWLEFGDDHHEKRLSRHWALLKL